MRYPSGDREHVRSSLRVLRIQNLKEDGSLEDGQVGIRISFDSRLATSRSSYIFRHSSLGRITIVGT